MYQGVNMHLRSIPRPKTKTKTNNLNYSVYLQYTLYYNIYLMKFLFSSKVKVSQLWWHISIIPPVGAWGKRIMNSKQVSAS